MFTFGLPRISVSETGLHNMSKLVYSLALQTAWNKLQIDKIAAIFASGSEWHGGRGSSLGNVPFPQEKQMVSSYRSQTSLIFSLPKFK